MTDTSTIPVPPADRWGGIFRPNRLVVVLLLAALAAWPGHLGMLTRSLMMDAYVQVSVFVAATLMLFYGAERLFNFDIGSALKTPAARRCLWPRFWVQRRAAAARSLSWPPTVQETWGGSVRWLRP